MFRIAFCTKGLSTPEEVCNLYGFETISSMAFKTIQTNRKQKIE